MPSFIDGRVMCGIEQHCNWGEMTALNECPCREELRAAAHSLVGQCIADAGRESLIRIRLATLPRCPGEGRPVAIFKARNELTELAALGLLHLLRHLSEERALRFNPDDPDPFPGNEDYRIVNFNWDLVGSDGLLNTSAYKFPRIRCGEAYFYTSLSSEQLLPRFARVFYPCHSLHALTLPAMEHLPILLRAIESGRSHGFKRGLSFYNGPNRLTNHAINSLIEYFRYEAPTLTRCTQHILLPTAETISDVWPSIYTDIRAGESDGIELRHFRRLAQGRDYIITNRPSGEKVIMRLISGSNDLHLSFNEFCADLMEHMELFGE